MNKYDLTNFEVALIRAAIRNVIDNELSAMFLDDYKNLYSKLLYASTKETE